MGLGRSEKYGEHLGTTAPSGSGLFRLNPRGLFYLPYEIDDERRGGKLRYRPFRRAPWVNQPAGEQQEHALDILQFKLDIPWSMLDAIRTPPQCTPSIAMLPYTSITTGKKPTSENSTSVRSSCGAVCV
jgi:hypothetical protein